MKYVITLKIVSLLLLLFSSAVGFAGEDAGENASNPLAKVKNTDLRWQYTDSDDSHVNNMFVDGAFMANDQLKIKYELHYWETDLTGSSEQGLESSLIKAIYFAKDAKVENRSFAGYRVAVGLDWAVDLGDEDKGIGTGSDTIGPFVGLALGYESGMTLIPLVQHFLDYSGDDVNMTAFRMIMIQPLPEKSWLKLDAKLPVDWEHDNAIPATVELQLGRTYSKGFGAYADLLAGLGSDRPYDWGLGVGVRFSY
ncbi:MAG: hypothetical protein GY875_05560 [Gammaproteobacteria bacterium]|nr:hypothetical protein [Gammaproteobacteria bacterium]